MKKLGIIGAMSWSSTARYCDGLNRLVGQRMGGRHTAVLAVETLDQAVIAEMQQAGDWVGLAKLAAEAGRRLAASGAGALILASDSLHKISAEVGDASALPIIDVSDATADRIVAEGHRRIALLGTRFTMEEDFARVRYTERGIAVQSIESRWQAEVDRIIRDELVRGRINRESQRLLKTLITELSKQKVDAVVLGCAELALVIDARANILPIYDTLIHHVRSAVEWMLGEVVEARAAA